MTLYEICFFKYYIFENTQQEVLWLQLQFNWQIENTLRKMRYDQMSPTYEGYRQIDNK